MPGPRRPSVKSLFTPEELDTLGSLARGVWDEVAYDCLQATADEKGKDINTIAIRRSQVIEIALDASRMEGHARGDKIALVKRFRELDYNVQQRLAKDWFSYQWYGM